MTGIYEIYNIRNGKRYIGQSVNIQERWSNHRRELNTGKHHNAFLQHAWNKYGEDAFRFLIIEVCDKESLDDRENYYIKAFQTMYNEYGYNLQDGGYGPRERSPYTLAKMSEATKKRWSDPEYRTHMSEAHKGQHVSQEAAEASRARMLELWSNEEWAAPMREKMQITLRNLPMEKRRERAEKISRAMKGKKKSAEHCKHMSESRKGKKHGPMSPKTAKHISEAKKGKPLTPEHIEALKNSHLKQQKGVAQYTLEGVLVATFISSADAARKTGCNQAHITQCCKGKEKRCGGYIWKYADEDHNTDVA